MQALEQGQSDALKNYLAVMSRFHRYSWGNCLLIYSQRPHATHIAGFHAWLKSGVTSARAKRASSFLRRWWEEEVRRRTRRRRAYAAFGFRAAHVFDVSQTEGDPLPEFATIKGDPK